MPTTLHAHPIETTLNQDGTLTLDHLPFPAGAAVEVIVLPRVAPDQAQDLVKNLVEQAMAGTMTFDKNLSRSFEMAIAAIDRKLSTQPNAILHDPKFSQRE